MTELRLGPLLFINKSKAEEHIRGILSRYSNMRPLLDRDRQVVDAILELHPNKQVIVDCGIKEILVQDLGKGQKRFIAKRLDGSVRDFTWRHAIQPRSSIQQLRKTCRTLIADQIEAFRRKAFASDIRLECPVTGEMVSRESCDIDHTEPHTFIRLVDQWLALTGSTADDIEIIPSREYQQPDRFQDEFLEEDWKAFHRLNARLRVVSRTANRSLLRRTKDRWKTPSLTPP